MDSNTINKFNKLIKSYNDESSKTKRKNISKKITKQVLNLKKNNKDRTKILNSYKKWLKNNNNEMKIVQTGGGASIDIFNNIKKQLNELMTDAGKFTDEITSLKEMFENPQPNTSTKDNIINNLSKNTEPLTPEKIQGLLNLFNNKNLLGNIINNYYNIFNYPALTEILANESHGTKSTWYASKNPYVKNGQFNDVIFSKIATGTFYEKKPNQLSKTFYASYNINALPPNNPNKSAVATGATNKNRVGPGNNSGIEMGKLRKGTLPSRGPARRTQANLNNFSNLSSNSGSNVSSSNNGSGNNSNFQSSPVRQVQGARRTQLGSTGTPARTPYEFKDSGKFQSLSQLGRSALGEERSALVTETRRGGPPPPNRTIPNRTTPNRTTPNRTIPNKKKKEKLM